MGSKRFLLIPLAAFLFLPTLTAQSAPQAPNPAEPVPVRTTPQPEKPPPQLSPEDRGDLYMVYKSYREAIERYKAAPQTAVTMNKIGVAYHQMSDLPTARKYYQRAIRLNPKFSDAVNNLGTIYYAYKDYGRAVAQYRKAIRLSPDTASFYSNLGTAYFSRKLYKEASEAYQKAVSLDKDVFERHGPGGQVMQESTVEEHAKFHYYLAKTFAQAGDATRAIQYIRKSIEEGFKDRQKFLDEPEFAALQDLPEFKEVMAMEPRVL
ncbi:MAG: tetratricopeptide repeat protein [Bryobacteraceae bacterium]